MNEIVHSAVIPPPADGPPDPPLTGSYVEKRHTVNITGATEALVVGPDEVLVVAFNDHINDDELRYLRDRLLDSRLAADQILLIAAGDVRMAKVKRDPPGRDYRRPTVDIVHDGPAL